MIKFDELTLAEIEEIELLLNEAFDQAFKTGKPKGRSTRVLYYIWKRRENPDYKFEETATLTEKQAVAFLTEEDTKKE